MGREIKRVQLNFNWPLRRVWKGYVNSHPGPVDCPECHGHGLNTATRELQQLWYDHDGASEGRWGYHYGIGRDGKPAERGPWKIWGDCRAWIHNITQDEVQALIDADRLLEFTHVWVPTNKPSERWQRREDGYVPTAAAVNEWSYHGFGHDAINSWICVKARAKRLGVYGDCPACKGRGHIPLKPRKAKKRYTHWRRTDPPIGTGYQVWETVSEGSPISPVFSSRDALIVWLIEHENYSAEGAWNYSAEGAWNFVYGDGWVPSMVLADGKIYKDVESARLTPAKTEFLLGAIEP